MYTLAPGDLPRSTVWNKPKTRPILAIRQHDRLLQVTLQRSGGGRGRQKLERLHRVPRARRVPAGALRGLSPRRRAPPRRLDLFVERHQLGEAAHVPLPPRPPRLLVCGIRTSASDAPASSACRPAALVVERRLAQRVPHPHQPRVERALHRDRGEVVWRVDERVLEDARRVPHARVREDGEEGDRGREEGPALQQLRHAVRVGAVGEAPPRHVPC
mmetsp:Transcript_32582/g.104659  ORF Transcript_32582/g.104659 Transcript_32582/m.104659 type:complete len:216 (+) Transcript_32582:44-691(+)